MLTERQPFFFSSIQLGVWDALKVTFLFSTITVSGFSSSQVFCSIHTWHKLWTEIWKPLFRCKKLVINTTKCDLHLFLHQMCGIRWPENYVRFEPEDHWSCIAQLIAEDMLKSAVIEEKTFKHSPWAGADNPLGPKFWCQQGGLITMVICCKFTKNPFNLWLYTHLFMI